MRVKWTHRALDNLDSAVEFVAADKPTAAADVAKQCSAFKIVLIWSGREDLNYV